MTAPSGISVLFPSKFDVSLDENRDFRETKQMFPS